MHVGRWPIGLTALVATAFFFLGDLDVLNAVFGATVVVLVPVISVVQLEVVDVRALPRRAAYLNSITTILLLACVALALGLWRFGRAPLGLNAMEGSALAAWSVGLTVAGMGVIFAFVWLRSALGLEESDFVRYLLPEDRGDRGLFALLSFSAGVGEEIVFRSYLIAVLATIFSGWTAAAVAVLVFAAAHAYQGRLGMLRTAILGSILTAPLLVAGSIIPAMVAHTAIDLLSGLVFARALTQHRGAA